MHLWPRILTNKWRQLPKYKGHSSKRIDNGCWRRVGIFFFYETYCATREDVKTILCSFSFASFVSRFQQVVMSCFKKILNLYYLYLDLTSSLWPIPIFGPINLSHILLFFADLSPPSAFVWLWPNSVLIFEPPARTSEVQWIISELLSPLPPIFFYTILGCLQNEGILTRILLLAPTKKIIRGMRWDECLNEERSKQLKMIFIHFNMFKWMKMQIHIRKWWNIHCLC